MMLTSLMHVSDLPTYSPADQFGLLASISNYHKFGYLSINNPDMIVQPTTHNISSTLIV